MQFVRAEMYMYNTRRSMLLFMSCVTPVMMATHTHTHAPLSDIPPPSPLEATVEAHERITGARTRHVGLHAAFANSLQRASRLPQLASQQVSGGGAKTAGQRPSGGDAETVRTTTASQAAGRVLRGHLVDCWAGGEEGEL